MATSAKRYGLEAVGNLELELRLRRIEVALEKKADANLDATATTRSRSTPPQISGLRVVGQTPGTVTVGWNASPIPDLRRYDVDFAEDTGFTQNKQSFRERTTQFVFSTASSTGGGGGTVFFCRVRAVNSAGTPGVFSVTLNTATGEVVSGDIADGAIDTDQLADEAVTSEKTDITDIVSGLTLPGPPFDAAEANDYVRINSSATAYTTQEGTLPPVAQVSDVGKLIRVAGGDDLDYTSYTFPSVATLANYFRGNGTNFVLREGTLPDLAVAGDAAVQAVAYVDAADSIDFWDQDPSDAAATAGGSDGANRTGTLTLPGGFVLHWNTVDLVNATDTDITVAGGVVKSVIACAAEASGGAPTEPVSAWVKDADEITLRQVTGANLEITFWVIMEA